MSYKLEKTTAGYDIVIDGWEDGIADNPYKGIADMRNIDNVTVPGEASVALSTETTITQAPITNTTFTANVSNVLTYDGVVPLVVNTAITVSNSGGSLPSPLVTNTPYYIKSAGATTFTLATSAGGAEIDITTTGTGTHSFSTIQMGTPKYFANGVVRISSSTYELNFVLDSNGRCWVYDVSTLGGSNKWVYMHNQSSEGSLLTGNGLVVFEGYLFWFSSNTIGVIPLINYTTGLLSLSYLTTLSSWVQNWNTTLANANSSISHQAIVAQDDAVYFCNALTIGSILKSGDTFNIASTHVATGGADTSGSKYITTSQSFFSSSDVGAYITATGITAGTIIASVSSATGAFLDTNAVSTNGPVQFSITTGYTYNASALQLPSYEYATCLAELNTNLLIGGVNNFIYPWDRVSTSYNPPIFLSENNTTRMVTVNTTTYIFLGFNGRIYQTNGSNVSIYWEIPEYLSNTTNPYFFWTDAVFNRNQLYFGFQSTTNNNTTINQYGGLWAIDLDTGKGKLQNIMSYGTYSGYVSAIGINRGVLNTSTPANDGYGLFAGWYDGSVGGIDKGISTPYTGGQSYICSDMIPVGTFLNKKTYKNIEFKLTTPLVTGESVALAYRTSINDSYTDVPIIEGGQVGDVSGITNVNFQGIQWLQIKATLTSTASTPSFCRLKEIRVR